ncbi:hypothetical protein CPAV1605_759 [seawater metagenome]|uniref:GlcNAc-PI de-N-acetylase n=1 Tax=seawater metagenome TaxID=1561972 RepID=A0A5E8CK43_9ZZZZ
MDKKYNLFISPHLDDVVFSLSQVLKNMIALEENIIIATVFTQENPELLKTFTGDYYHYANYPERKREDKNVITKLSSKIKIIYLDLQDEIFRKENNEKKIILEIREKINKLLNDFNIINIYCPLGIGYHLDHIITYTAINFFSNKYQINLYYDYPYCTIKLNKITRLSEFGIFQEQLHIQDLIDYYNNPIYSSCFFLIRIIKIIILLFKYIFNFFNIPRNFKVQYFITQNKLENMKGYHTQINPIFGNEKILKETITKNNLETIINFI